MLLYTKEMVDSMMELEMDTPIVEETRYGLVDEMIVTNMVIDVMNMGISLPLDGVETLEETISVTLGGLQVNGYEDVADYWRGNIEKAGV